ncbi:MAG TPA: uroporphyrinogen decarboxylase family protein [Bacteroidales bacterium]|nr:uroporphyrinogen decarboxylase family protein [Bacteroidales bacterium]
MAVGSPADVTKAVKDLLDSITDKPKVLLSCGGGMPPNVSTENIRAFIEATK